MQQAELSCYNSNTVFTTLLQLIVKQKLSISSSLTLDRYANMHSIDMRVYRCRLLKKHRLHVSQTGLLFACV